MLRGSVPPPNRKSGLIANFHNCPLRWRTPDEHERALSLSRVAVVRFPALIGFAQVADGSLKVVPANPIRDS
jgi:hypothetical protein